MQRIQFIWKAGLILLLTLSFLISPFLEKKGETLSKKKTNQNTAQYKPIVKGLYGKPRTLANRWLQKQADFISIHYKSGKQDKFIKLGILEGHLKSGQTLSIEIQEDFYGNHPGMIREHLRALKHQAEILPLGKEELKNQFELRGEYRKWQKIRYQESKEAMQEDINERLDQLLKSELSSAEKAVLTNLENKLKPQIRLRLIHMIEDQIKRESPDLWKWQFDRAVSQKMNQDLEAMIKKELENMIVNEKIDHSPEWQEARDLVHRVLSRFRAEVTAEIQSNYNKRGVRRLEAMKKRFQEEGRVWDPPKEPGLVEKIIKWIKSKGWF